MKEFVVASSTGTRVRVTFIPSKRDRQFIFDGSGVKTSNDLCWITREGDVPEETWNDTYVDIEVTRWGHSSGPST